MEFCPAGTHSFAEKLASVARLMKLREIGGAK